MLCMYVCVCVCTSAGFLHSEHNKRAVKLKVVRESITRRSTISLDNAWNVSCVIRRSTVPATNTWHASCVITGALYQWMTLG